MTQASAQASTRDQRADHRVHLVQGEFQVSNQTGLVLTTTLGSCVASCLYDPFAGVGGMNHFLLPHGENFDGPDAIRYGAHAMELLINGLLHAGARKSRLEAKLFGGARISDHLPDVGGDNAAFAEHFLRYEAITYLGGSTRGFGGAPNSSIGRRPAGRANCGLAAPTARSSDPSPSPLASRRRRARSSFSRTSMRRQTLNAEPADRHPSLREVVARVCSELVDLSRSAEVLQATISTIVARSPAPLEADAQIRLQAADALSQRLDQLARLMAALEPGIAEDRTLGGDQNPGIDLRQAIARLSAGALVVRESEGECEFF